MFKSGSKAWLIVVTFAVSLAALDLLVYIKHRQERPYLQLSARQRQINALAAGALHYVEDHKEHYPSADRWKVQLAPYVEQQYLRDTSHVAMNRILSDRSLEDVKDCSGAILFFEAIRSPSADIDAIPLQSDAYAFAVSFADGHGYERAFRERDDLIRSSKEATAPLR